MAQTTDCATISQPANVPKPQSAPDHAFAVADRADRFLDAVGDHLGMLDVVHRGIDDARDQHDIVRQGDAAQRGIFVLVARIGEFDRERTDAGRADHGQDVDQRHIAVVRAVVVPPAHVQAYALGRDVDAGFVDRIDVDRDGILELAQALVLEHAVALHGQVRAIELQDVAARMDEVVFLLEFARHRPDVGFVGVVVLVAQVVHTIPGQAAVMNASR